MRIRQIKPTLFRDKALMRCKPETVLFYVGLWCVADDAGWFEWDVAAIGADLFPFAGVTKRERDIERLAAVLQELDPDEPHLRLHGCGHAEVPKMPPHQRISDAKKVRTDYDRHLHGRCPAHPRGFPRDAADPRPGTGTEKERGTERDGMEQVAGAQARTNEDGRPSLTALSFPPPATYPYPKAVQVGKAKAR